MMRMKKRKTAVFACVIVLFFCAILLGLCWGSYEISVHEVIATLLGNGTKIQNTAIFGIRLPRILLGIFVAAGLAISGGVLQTMTRNELADPGIIGINAGGATAAVLFIQFQTNAYFSELGTFSIYLLPLMAISGALAAAFCIYFLSSRKGLKPKRLLLTGIGINAGLNAFITFFMFKGGPGDYNRVMIWTSGSLWGAGWAYVRALVPVILLGGAYIFYKGRMLDALSFSDETAIGWGISIERERKKCCSVQLFLREHRLHLLEISALSDCLRRMQQKSCWKRTPGITASCVFDRCSHADFCRYGRRKFIFTNRNPGGNCGVAGWCTVFCIPDVEGVARIWKQ